MRRVMGMGDAEMEEEWMVVVGYWKRSGYLMAMMMMIDLDEECLMCLRFGCKAM